LTNKFVKALKSVKGRGGERRGGEGRGGEGRENVTTGFDLLVLIMELNVFVILSYNFSTNGPISL